MRRRPWRPPNHTRGRGFSSCRVTRRSAPTGWPLFPPPALGQRRYLTHPDLADCIHHVLALRDQNIDLPQLRNDFFRLVSLPCHCSPPGCQRHTSSRTTSMGAGQWGFVNFTSAGAGWNIVDERIRSLHPIQKKRRSIKPMPPSAQSRHLTSTADKTPYAGFFGAGSYG
jgi:hypothetical protein